MKPDQDPRPLDEETFTGIPSAELAEKAPGSPHLTSEEMEAFLTAQLKLAERTRVEEHLAECGVCLTQFNRIYREVRGARESFEQILLDLRAEDRMKRHDAVLVVQRKAESGIEIPEAVLIELVEHVRTDSSRIVQDVAADTLGVIGERAALPEAIAALLERSESKDTLVRRSCALALSSLIKYVASPIDKSIAERLKQLAEDPEWVVREALAPSGAPLPPGIGGEIEWEAPEPTRNRAPVRIRIHFNQVHKLRPRLQKPSRRVASRHMKVAVQAGSVDGETIPLAAGHVGDSTWSLLYQKPSSAGQAAFLTLRIDSENEAYQGKTITLKLRYGDQSYSIEMTMALDGTGLVTGSAVIQVESEELSAKDVTVTESTDTKSTEIIEGADDVG